MGYANNAGRNRVARRLSRLMFYLQGRRYIDLKVIARGLGVTEKTVRRDLAALEEAGWPVPRYRLNPDGDVMTAGRSSTSSGA